MNIRFTPGAEHDMIEIEEYLLSRSPALPDKFFEELMEMLHLLALKPKAGIGMRKGYRRFHLIRFSYNVIYEVHNATLVVVHIVHDKRHPKLKFRRIK